MKIQLNILNMQDTFTILKSQHN